MNPTIDFGKLWQFIASPITVILSHGGIDQSVPYVLKRAGNLEDFSQEPAILEEDTTVFHLWADHLGGVVPLKGDKVTTADGVVWHVTRVQTHNRGRRFRLTTFRERDT